MRRGQGRLAGETAGQATVEERFFRENLNAVLRTPAGYAVIREVLARTYAFLPVSTPDELARRDFAEDFFMDVQEANPDAALRLFADVRGFPCVTTINSQEG